MAIDYSVFYSRQKGAAYRASQVESYSNYNKPVDHSPGRPAGNSRIWGDIALDRQRIIINAIITAARAAGFNLRRMALLLAMVKIESGFNLDAAAGTTSASSLGQFVKKTGAAYGLNDGNRFDLAVNVAALVSYFLENEKLARKRGKPDIWVYKYHHDGPSGDYGGEALATKKFSPLADKYEKALNVGHALTIIDPGGAPIGNAQIKVTQNGKSTVLKTNEHGVLPKFQASPTFGALTVFIQKASDEFKQIGEIALTNLESAWTIVAPKQRATVKTHVHEPHKSAPPGDGKTHKVEKGETLSGIARRAGTTYLEIAKLNNIAKPYLLHPGQILKMPAGDAKKAPAKVKPAAPPPPKPVQAAQPPAPQAKPPAQQAQPLMVAADSAQVKPPEPPADVTDSVDSKPEQAPAPPPVKPVVTEKRSAQTSHPEAQVAKPVVSNRIEAAIAYAMAHKKAKSIGRCLAYVKKALLAAGYFKTYPGCEHAKDFGPFLQKAGFVNLLESAPGTNLNTAPLGSVAIYKPVEAQSHDGKVISGHIEIKCPNGRYVSDFVAMKPTYSTNPVTLVSPVLKKYKVSFKVIGIWYKE